MAVSRACGTRMCAAATASWGPRTRGPRMTAPKLRAVFWINGCDFFECKNKDMQTVPVAALDGKRQARDFRAGSKAPHRGYEISLFAKGHSMPTFYRKYTD